MAAAANELELQFAKVHLPCNNAAAGTVAPVTTATYNDWDWDWAGEGAHCDHFVSGMEPAASKRPCRGVGLKKLCSTAFRCLLGPQQCIPHRAFRSRAGDT
jgi:hypothetical protein